jgi:hypothetical protein
MYTKLNHTALRRNNRTPISPPIIGQIPALVHFSPPPRSPVFAGSPSACEKGGDAVGANPCAGGEIREKRLL